MENVRFSGLIDDLMIRKMSINEITRNQTAAKATENIAKILRVIKQDDIDVPKVQIKDIDFSMATMQFLDFSECELHNIILPADDRHLLIDNGLCEITKYVSDEIKKSWYNAGNQSWALNCVNNIQNEAPTAIICWQDFKHFEDEEFADKLMELFRKAKKNMDDNKRINLPKGRLSAKHYPQ